MLLRQGLSLIDYRRRGGFGPEKLTNGAFAGAAPWDFTHADWVFNTDHAEYDGTSTSSIIQLIGDLVSLIDASTDYRITFDVLGGGGAARMAFTLSNGNTLNADAANYANGSHVLDFTSPGPLTGSGFAVYGFATGGAFNITNISFKERL